MTDYLNFFRKRNIFVIAAKRFFDEKISYRASALAFESLFSLVPFLLVILFFVEAFPFFEQFILIGKAYILQNFVPSSANVIEQYLRGFLLQATRLPIINIIFLLASVTILVYTIEETLNDIWNVSNRPKFNIAMLIFWLVFLMLPLIIGVSLFMSTYFFSISWIKTALEWLDFTKIVFFLLPLFINTLLFFCIYKFMPNISVNWKHALFGGFLAAFLFDIARFIFAYYVTRFPSYALIYGTFAVFPIFLLWLYIFWVIVLYCALVANTMDKATKR